MPKRIPIKAARDVAKAYRCRQVILLAWDGDLTHVVTYGKSLEDCAQAAEGGNSLKKKFGWPESLQAQPSRIRKLVSALESTLPALEQGKDFQGEVLEVIALVRDAIAMARRTPNVVNT
jgi:hypothetical protein